MLAVRGHRPAAYRTPVWPSAPVPL